MILCALLMFMWDASPTATHYTIYEQVNGAWIQRSQTTQTDLLISFPKGLRTFAVSASNAYGESPLSNPVTKRVKR